MKFGSKIAVAVIVGLFAGAAVADTVTTNRIGQVFSTDSNGVVTLVSGNGGGSSQSLTLSPAFGAQLSTTVTLAPTSYTPRGFGDVLIGTVSDKVYVATGVATSDWTEVAEQSTVAANLASATSNFAAVNAKFGALIDTNASPSVTLSTARFAGDLLIGTASGTIWVATSAGTNSWVSIK